MIRIVYMKKILIIIFSLFISGCKVEHRYTVNGDDMYSTISRGQSFILSNKKHYNINDIVLYEIPNADKSKTQYSGRVLGVPGDKIRIRQGKIYVNDEVFSLPPTATFHYSVKLSYTDAEVLKDFKITSESLGYYDSFLSETDSIKVCVKYKNILTYIRRCYLLGLNQEVLLMGKNKLGWDQDNFGPITIPPVKSRESLDWAHLFLNELDSKNISNNEYLVGQDYYFIVCDNFHNGYDSRSFGLVGEDQIVGMIKIK